MQKLRYALALSQKGSSLARLAAEKAEDGGLQGVDGNDNAETKGGPMDSWLFLLGKDTKQVPGQNQGAS